MSNELLKNILQEMCDKEFAEYETSEEHDFSLKHRRKMKKLFREYEKKSVSDISAKTTTYSRKRIAVIVIIATAFVLSCVTAGAWVTGGFKSINKSDHTEIFNIDYANAPQTIEYLYYISALPDEYKLTDSNVDTHFSADFIYENEDGDFFNFTQEVKSGYKNYLNTEHSKLEEVIVNNKNGYFIAFENRSLLVWDNGDYVLEIYGDFSKEEMINLAKSAKIKDS